MRYCELFCLIVQSFGLDFANWQQVFSVRQSADFFFSKQQYRRYLYHNVRFIDSQVRPRPLKINLFLVEEKFDYHLGK
jgi:hypothetical protein